MYQPARAYQSTTPCANAVLKKKWDETIYKLHRDKVMSARSYLDNKSPKTYLHLHQRLKKYVMDEYRAQSIQRDNYLLLMRMAEIMQTRSRIDNYNDYQIKSLNGPLRQRELLRLAQENQAILARIEAQTSHYNHKKWQQEWREKKEYMAFIAKFPHTGIHHKQRLKVLKLGESPESAMAGQSARHTTTEVQSTHKEKSSL